MYREYGLYKNKRQMLPNIYDGLLPVQKRILLAAHTIAKNKFIKTYKVLGETMSRWHPHSEALGTAEWAVHNGFLDGDGLWGTNIGTEKLNCAAPRYTSLKMNDFIEEMAFEMVNYVDWVPDEADPEPISIPTMLPFCFLVKFKISSIGFGFKTDIPCFKMDDLIKRLQYLLTNKKKIIIKPNIPGCNITSKLKDCEKLLKTGQGVITAEGNHHIENSTNSIIIYGWNPCQTFQCLFDKIDKYKNLGLFSEGQIRYVDISTENETKIKFEVVQKRNTEEIFDNMVKAVTENIKFNIAYNIVAIRDNNISQPSVDEMLLLTYQFYKDTYQKYLIITKKEIVGTIKEFEIIQKIRPFISQVVKLTDINDMYEFLSKKSKCSISDIKQVIEKYKIKKLLIISIDINDTQNKLIDIERDLNNIDSSCIKKYETLIRTNKKTIIRRK